MTFEQNAFQYLEKEIQPHIVDFLQSLHPEGYKYGAPQTNPRMKLNPNNLKDMFSFLIIRGDLIVQYNVKVNNESERIVLESFSDKSNTDYFEQRCQILNFTMQYLESYIRVAFNHHLEL